MSITSVIRYVRALDSAATDGSGKAGLAFGDVTAKYLTQGGTLTSLTTETVTTLGTYQAPSDASHVRIKELAGSDPTKGVYEVHFHDTQMASSGVKLWLFLSASGAAFQPLEVDLADVSGRLPAALTADGNIKADTLRVGGSLQTARDLGASVLLSVGTGTGQVNLSGGKVPATLASTDVTGNVASDVQTIKTQAVTCSGGVTVPAATLASTANITAGTITTVTNLTNAPASGDFTSAMKASLDAATPAVTVTTNNDKTGYSLTSAYDPAKTAAQAGDAMSLTAGERNSTADALLNRDMAAGADSGGRTARNALRFLRNKFSITGGTLTVCKEDDATAAWTSSLTTDNAADPITASDPG